jgi:hypothetical protein
MVLARGNTDTYLQSATTYSAVYALLLQANRRYLLAQANRLSPVSAHCRRQVSILEQPAERLIRLSPRVTIG